MQCCYLAASCLREAKEYGEAMEIWESCTDSLENSKNIINLNISNNSMLDWTSGEILNSDNNFSCNNNCVSYLSYFVLLTLVYEMSKYFCFYL